MSLPSVKLPTIKIFRWDAEEIYDKNNVLIGYIERQGELYREIYLDTYNVIVWGDESPRERKIRLRNESRLND